MLQKIDSKEDDSESVSRSDVQLLEMVLYQGLQSWHRTQVNSKRVG